jgi:hypothetical protein
MTKFEEFEEEMGDAVTGLLPGAKCGKIVVTFVNDDGTVCEIGLIREGFEQRLGAPPDEDDCCHFGD